MIIYFLLLIFQSSIANENALSQQIYRFIFSHEGICGDPFVDPDWLPAIDECVIGCEEHRFICLMNTENKQQKCQSLPRLCISALAREFNWPDEEGPIDANVEQFQKNMLQLGTDNPGAIYNGYFQTTTLLPVPQTTEGNIIASGYGEGTIYEQALTSEPQIQTTEVTPPKTTPPMTLTASMSTSSTITTTFAPAVESLQEIEQPFLGYEYPIQHPYEGNQYEVEASTNPAPEVTRTSILSPIRIDTTKKFSLEYTNSYFTLKVKSSQPIETTEMPTPTSKNHDYPSRGSRIDLIPPPPPPDPVAMDSVDERFLSRMITQFKVENTHKTPKQVDPTGLKDRSRRCCEWALNGLCDRTWQKVRVMCPKSCGVVSCEDVDGIKSCNRIADVDVEECYQSLKKKARVFAAPVYKPFTVRRKSVTVKPSTVVTKSTSKKHKKKKRSKKHRKL